MTRQRVRREITDKAQQQFYPSRDPTTNGLARLAWAVNFAQEDVEQFTPGQKLDTETALTVFPGAVLLGREKEVEIFSESELTQAHQELNTMFRTWARDGFYQRDKAPPIWIITNIHPRPSLEFRSNHDVPQVEQFMWRVFALLYEYGDRIRVCPAPAKRGEPGEKCNRIFVGRTNQTYCSQLCQNRTGVQAARKKAKGADHDRKRRRDRSSKA
jgi:hypothetical protein